MGGPIVIEVHQTEIDGIPCFWVNSGRPTLAASLMFRIGTVDQVASSSGWIHLLEHLALHEAESDGALSINGSVSLLETRFDAHGPAPLLAAHLLQTSSRLHRPHFDHLSRECEILQAESRLRSGPLLDALAWRYGTRGPGLAGIAEMGLFRAEQDALADLSARVFTRANAVLALDGPPPAGLRFDLPDGDSMLAIPDAIPCPGVFPALYPDHRGLIASGTAERTHAATLLPMLLERELRDRLRHRDGAAYAPWSHYEPVDTRTALLVAGSDVSTQHAPTVATTFIDVLDGLLRDGPDADHLRAVVAKVTQQVMDPYNVAAFAWRSATQHLQRASVESPDEVLDELASVTDEAVLTAAASWKSTALIGCPEQLETPPGLHPVTRPVVTSRPGKRFPHKNWPADRVLLSIGEEAVQLVLAGDAIEVRRDEITGLAMYPNGTRTVIGADGWHLTVDPSEWHYGDAAREILDRSIPRRLHLALPEDQQIDKAFTRDSFWKRWFVALRRSPTVIVASICLVLAAACIVAWIETDQTWFLYGLGFLTVQLFFAFSDEDDDEDPLGAWSRFGDGG